MAFWVLLLIIVFRDSPKDIVNLKFRIRTVCLFDSGSMLTRSKLPEKGIRSLDK